MQIRLAKTAEDRAACFALRKAVFMGEQNVSEAEEWDGLDDTCLHFLAIDQTGPAGVARLLPKGNTAKIQRVAVLPGHRGTGLGRQIMETVLDHARQAGFHHAVLDAQTHALGFYEVLGFVAHGPVFDDAGIPHQAMERAL
ncbi:GNAT family N-acetyltransferase [Nioella nitratireducens]|uniref:GNAT family N-acetyltransferase n=1 Tax=Nioella nitratireducens TaxID=1287720 RepID=UPI0008FCE63B|nr:GNAT family N-acetyltransferase [Nioella nitratireducens]